MPRFSAVDDHGIRSVRIRPGHEAAVIDASAAGALLETSHRLLPGSVVDLRVDREDHPVNVRGRVVRCAVVQVRASTVFYRGGIAFDRHLPWSVPVHGYRLPGGDSSESSGQRGAATPLVV